MAGQRLILNFHGIGEPGPWVPDAEIRYWCPLSLWPSLADAMVGLRDAGRPLEITFDDGNRSDVERALPALAERGLTATFFVCAGRIGSRGYLDDSDLRTLRSSGMSIGSHGWNHVDLRRVDDVTLVRESLGSRERLSEYAADEFAIPFGSYDRRVLRSLRAYRRVHTSDGGLAGHGRISARQSYVSGWTPEHILGMGTPVPVMSRALRAARRHLKRWR